ncbi:MAG TPA: hypothetical protein VFW25_03680 [Silvibacterium sp.]|nr:hypothetical protein [Silvibacterium sp.]
MAIFAISSFVVIFLFAILWATRPPNKHEAEQHGTSQAPESSMPEGHS